MVFHIADDHFAETFRIFVLRTTQKNDFIAQNDSGILLDVVFRDVVGRIGLEARDKIGGWPRKLDNLTWCKMPVKLTWKGRAFYEKVV